MYDELSKLKKEGKIKYLGFSFHGTPDLLKEIVKEHKWDFCQLQINYLDWELVKAKEQYEDLLVSSLKSNDFNVFFKIFDSNCDNLRNVRFKYQSLLVSNKTEVDKFLSYVKSINSSSYYFLNNNFNKAQNVLNYINQNSNNEALKEYKDNYIYLDLSLDELKQYKEFYDM